MATVIKRYDYKPSPGEVNDGETIVEPAGYIPANIKIESMIEAGQRLADFRRGYEFQDGEVIPDDYYDPTRNPGFDLADASRLSVELASRPKTEKSVEKTEEKRLRFLP